MTELQRIEDALLQTLADRKVSRSERRALRGLLDDADPNPEQVTLLRDRVFDAARGASVDARDARVLDWCEQVVDLLAGWQAAAARVAKGVRSEVLFSPGEACLRRIAGLVSGARRTVDICVFTITDDRISRAILDAHRRKIAVRIVTDVEKARDPGSDIYRLGREGVPVAVDTSDKHMHHKFAIFDGATVLTGSYNWTRSAAAENEENIVVTDDERVVRDFQGEFDRLWGQFAR